MELTRALLEYVLSGDVRPGQRLPGERALSEALGVGRAALREATKSLILLGVLEQRQGDGTFLSRSQANLLPQVIEWGLLLNRHDLDGLIEARFYLEVTLAGLAAERRDADQLARMARHIERMRNAANDHDDYVAADIDFHLEVADASGSPVLAGVLSNVRSLLQAWARRVISAAGETESSLAVHTPIFEAIEARDVVGAEAAMRAHMERATRRLRATIEEPVGLGVDR
uniref:FadR/GntR family transcriptional regulator n=1 Tax=Dactylosporangium roseum TaxID=47989 RepID=UPI0028C4A4A0|nr:FadR/GntR family transcriptional regulator [Dactylosporangium roseum]